jgi:hypothetical protein
MNESQTTRREMCRTTLRCLALGGIAVLSGTLVERAASAGCRRAVSCRDCAALGKCDLPQALDTKRGEAKHGQ